MMFADVEEPSQEEALWALHSWLTVPSLGCTGPSSADPEAERRIDHPRARAESPPGAPAGPREDERADRPSLAPSGLAPARRLEAVPECGREARRRLDQRGGASRAGCARLSS